MGGNRATEGGEGEKYGSAERREGPVLLECWHRAPLWIQTQLPEHSNLLPIPVVTGLGHGGEQEVHVSAEQPGWRTPDSKLPLGRSETTSFIVLLLSCFNISASCPFEVITPLGVC